MKKSKNKIMLFLSTLIFGVTLLFTMNYKIILNQSSSLPFSFVIVKKGELPQRIDDIFVFRIKNPKAYDKKEMLFIKLLAGKEGQNIEYKQDLMFVGGKEIGIVKKMSLKGRLLEGIKTKTIKKKQFFAYTPHRDSYDSRYNEIGLINANQIIGTAVFAY